MAKYKKRPVEIEAELFTRSTFDRIVEFTNGKAKNLLIEKRLDGIATCVIPTLEGNMIAKEGDFIIKGVKGEFYPCKPDIFTLTYEAVDIITADELTYDLGEVIQGDTQVFDVPIYNSSAEHVHLSPWASCGCTTPTPIPQVIPPYSEGKLTVAFDTKDKGGLQVKKFGVNYKQNKQSYGLSFTLKAQIKKP